ncbi:UNVERIFIED_CONTAM: hypothetical protein Sangu_2814200 [Sesamum angustifolium]|uniref:Uncharacterized protein n=1 Tax=Sesamum angustifolium TaxID=2727405 RepID=A0AAW2IRK7_9LAMI
MYHNTWNRLHSQTREQVEELLSSRERLKWEKNMLKDLHIKQAAALVVKLEGNSLFSSGDISGAALKYSEALALCPMSLWRRAQAYDMLGLAKESLLDAILYINESQSHPEFLYNKTRFLSTSSVFVRKQMRAAWLFREAAIKHGGVHCEGDAGDICSQETDDSEWETASESDIG